MTPPSILANLTLGYQLVWDRARQPAGVLLFVGPNTRHMVDGAHLLGALAQAWSEHAPRLMLLVQSASLLADVLAHAAPRGPWITVQQALLADPSVAPRVQQAHARGVQLAWRGEPGQQPGQDMAHCFAQCVLSLTAGAALLASRAALRDQPARSTDPASPADSPVLARHIYEAVASRLLVDHCLDGQGAWGIAGWPADDVLHAYRHAQVQPDQEVIARLVAATDADVALERIESILTEEPVLVYRFLRHANSAALGLRSSVDSLRHGMMVLGLATFKRWLLEQLPAASHDADLQPVRSAMVLRARLMELLLDAGDEDQLRNEVQLCGLLSQIDLLLGEPLAAALQRFPVSERITASLLGHTGPYAPFLEIAKALEYPHMAEVPALCEVHGLDMGDVNRALLRALAQAQPPPLNLHSRF